MGATLLQQWGGEHLLAKVFQWQKQAKKAVAQHSCIRRPVLREGGDPGSSEDS